MAPAPIGTTAPAGTRDYTHNTSGGILSAVRDLTANMVAPPLTPLEAGDVITSKSGVMRYKLVKCRRKPGVFRLQSMSNLQILHGEWTAGMLELVGVRKV